MMARWLPIQYSDISPTMVICTYTSAAGLIYDPVLIDEDCWKLIGINDDPLVGAIDRFGNRVEVDVYGYERDVTACIGQLIMGHQESILSAIARRPVLLCTDYCNEHTSKTRLWPCLLETAKQDLGSQIQIVDTCIASARGQYHNVSCSGHGWERSNDMSWTKIGGKLDLPTVEYEI